MNKKINDQFIKKLISDPKLRAEATKRSHKLFFSVYFAHCIQYKIAPFQEEMFQLTEDENNPLTILCAFRESGKSTIITLSYVLWAILGIQKKKFVVILSQTQDQARQHFKNLKHELENNKLLKADLGPFKEEQEWNMNSIVLKKHGARITVASSDQAVRGIKHGANRPDLIIADDIEDSSSVKTREGRNKTYDWFNSEVMPLGSRETKIFLVGNLLHEDSLIMRLKQEIKDGERTGIYREYPIIDDQNNILWLGKFPNLESIEKERKRIGDKFSWAREYLLKIMDRREAVVQKEWIHTYNPEHMPEPLRGESCRYLIGIDPAFLDKDTSDFTAMVACKIIGSGSKSRIYILPNPINERIPFHKIIDRVEPLVNSLGEKTAVKILIEEAGGQSDMIQQLWNKDYRVEGVPIKGMDKRSRLIMTTNLITSGRILFASKGNELLLQQILGFGIEKHDDLVDAFVIAILYTINHPNEGEDCGFKMVRFDAYDEIERKISGGISARTGGFSGRSIQFGNSETSSFNRSLPKYPSDWHRLVG